MNDEDIKRKCLFNDCESQPGAISSCCLFCEEASDCDDRCQYTSHADRCVWRVSGNPKKEMK